MIFAFIFIFLLLLVFLLLRKHELFNVRLEKATSFYDDYRNFLEGDEHLLTKNRKDKRLIPYKINTKCFDEKYRSCLKKSKCGNSKVVDKLCEEDSFNSCVINSFNY